MHRGSVLRTWGPAQSPTSLIGTRGLHGSRQVARTSDFQFFRSKGRQGERGGLGHTIVSIVVETCRNAEEAVGDEDRLHRAHGPDTGKMRIRAQGQQSPRSAVRVRPYVLFEIGACADHKQSLGSVHGARGVGAQTFRWTVQDSFCRTSARRQPAPTKRRRSPAQRRARRGRSAHWAL